MYVYLYYLLLDVKVGATDSAPSLPPDNNMCDDKRVGAPVDTKIETRDGNTCLVCYYGR